MLRAKIKIVSGEQTDAVVDSQDYGLIYLDSDKRVGADQKPFEVTSYPEESGEHILPKTSDEAFDYTAKFFVTSDGDLENANKKIRDFNALLHTDPDNNGYKEYYQVEFYNDYKRHKIVGYPHEIHEASQFWRDRTGLVNDVVVVEWTIRVNDPKLCDFNYVAAD